MVLLFCALWLYWQDTATLWVHPDVAPVSSELRSAHGEAGEAPGLKRTALSKA